ncbi:universal stress protein [Pseudonocardia parietis]|uniref:Nucleotide-binding universal stress UspA family protein n=1 Tax=Pseudonocardia parietis TaxID=570936 RepID=A0ABS4VTN4_9PSEU|nr:universal stress protein [Pseudonocardia parietis]MBP2367276.1 nucleotide-binding universal stress UspA family protein [Pseudonocardia parietis]
MSPRPVTVGVTGTPGAAALTRWAAREALARGCSLRIVHAATYDSGDVPAWRRHARAVLARAVGVARSAAPGVDVETALVHEPPLRALTTAATEADLLVLGAFGHGRPGDGPAGPVLLPILRGAVTPVAAVHADTADHTGPVVVGVKHPDQDTPLLRAAHDFARRRDWDLRIVHAQGPRGRDGSVAERMTGLARDWSTDRVAVHADVVEDRALPALLRAAHHAGLLVVGNHRTGDRPRLRSTTFETVRAAGCPVLVVPVETPEVTARTPEPAPPREAAR